MFNRIYTYRLVLFFGLLVSFQYSYSQSENQLLKKSNSFFSKEDYRGAVNGFRQLLSNHITNIDYNYKYAVCLFYTKSPKSSQKYFDYLLNQEGFPVDVFYFKGRLYHFNYQFDQAIEMYEDYEKIKTSKDKDYHCLDEIKRCQNAKSLLKSPRAIEVISMQKVSKENYFSSYVFDSENYKLYSNSDVFSKMNQKKGFVPKYVFKRGMKYRFFSSYSKLENTQKDIFIQQKDADNEWKEPVRLGVEINSSFNEDFPFFDENTGFLYFSSDGHSSIGGMDVFRVSFNIKNLTFGTIENLNFPYSSTYDDFLYIPIESASYAYFSTNRNSDVGSVEVVKSKLSDREVPTFVSRLIFRNEIDDENTSAQFYLTHRNSTDKFGPFNTNDSGFVNILIPAPGIYKLTATVDGSDKEFSEEINFPPKVEGYDYQVECLFKLQESKEVLFFDEQLTDQSSLLADVNVVDFQEISKLIVNSESIKANEEVEENNEVSELSQEEIDTKIDELYDIEAEIEDQKRQKTQVAKNLIKAKTTLASLDIKINRILENIETADSGEKESLQKELRDSFVKRKALIDNFDQQVELYDRFASDEELQKNYNEITAINKSISEKSYRGQTDSVRSLITTYKAPENHQPLIPSAPDVARERQEKMEEEFSVKEESIELLQSEILENKNSVAQLKEQLQEVSSVSAWENLRDSIEIIESKISNKIADKQSLELEREELSEKIIFAEESLLNLTLIETESNEADSLGIEAISIPEEDKVKFYADEVYINKVIEEQEKLISISAKRNESLAQISATNLPTEIKDSLSLTTENEFIEDVTLQVNETFSESNNELNELIQLSQNNIEEIIEKNESLTSINNDQNPRTEGENTMERNDTTSENTSTSEEDRSSENLASSNVNREEENAFKRNDTTSENTSNSEEERSSENLATSNVNRGEENTIERNNNTSENTESNTTSTSEEERSADNLASSNEKTEEENTTERNNNSSENTESNTTSSSEEERSTENLASSNEPREDNNTERNDNTSENTESNTTSTSDEERSTYNLASYNERTEEENALERNDNSSENTESITTSTSEEERSANNLASSNETTEEENALQRNDNSSENTESITTSTSEEERSANNLASSKETTKEENTTERNDNSSEHTESNTTSTSEEERSANNLASSNETTKEENTTERNDNSSENTESITTSTSEEERSTDTLASFNETTEEENTTKRNDNSSENTESNTTSTSEEERSTENLASSNETRENNNNTERNDNTSEITTSNSEEERSADNFASSKETTEEENTIERNDNSSENTESITTSTSEEERSADNLASSNETTEEENTTERNYNSSENTESITTSTSEEERSTEIKSDDISNEVIDVLVQGNSKTIEYLTSLVLEESMGDESTNKLNDIQEIVLYENDLKQYFKKELDIAIAKEKIENKYLDLKSKFPNVKFEGKNNIEAQLRELKIKENDLKIRMKSASSNNVKSLMAQLIDTNKVKIEFLVKELEELEELDQAKLNIESVKTTANNRNKIQRTNAYYNYVLERNKIESENQLLGELLIKNEEGMLSLDVSLRDNMNSNELTKEQGEQIKALEDIQEVIAYLKESIELNKSSLTQDENAKSYEFLYQNRVNPVIDINRVTSRENNTREINDLTNEFSVSLKTSKESNQNISPNTDAFISYAEKRALLNLKLEELEQLTSNEDKVSSINSESSRSELEISRNELEISQSAEVSFRSELESSRNEEENSFVEGYLYVNEVKKEKISREIISLVNAMNSSDSSDLFESYINNKISYESLASSDRINQSILDVLPPNNSERNSFVVLEEEVVVQNKETLPILESNPSGLNFRVQVGAFRRPVREDVYREFTPVSGQQLTNGLIVYMAGYFNNSSDAVSAQKSIRSIGYSDAFIVSYCNDERLPFWKGKEYERSGKCLASNRNETIALNSSNQSVGTNVENNSLTNETESSTSIVSEGSNAMNEVSTPSSKIEQHGDNLVGTIDVKGLFYSVQVGAFNRKIRGNELSQLKELNYYRASGLYRYSSGKFDSLEKARERQKEVVSLGITDAFIVAYYNGERVSIQKSRNLLIEKGNSILFENVVQTIPLASNLTNESIENRQTTYRDNGNVERSKPIEIPIIRAEEQPKKVNMVSYSFNAESFEEGTIERLNRIGVFHYDESDAIIKSSVMNKSELTPIMSFYMKGMEEKEFAVNQFVDYSIEVGTKIPGKLANWLLRTNKTFGFIVFNGVNHLRFYLNSDLEKTELREELNQLLK